MRILYNAHIYTQDPRCPAASALAIEGGQILATGDDEGILSQFEHRKPGTSITLENLSGRWLLPGLIDAHLHLENYALALRKVDCETSTKEECLERVAERARQAPPGEWILGHGWNQNAWEGGFGCAADLDAVAPMNPVFLTAKSLHAAWANSAALRLAREGRCVSAETPDPPGGKLGRLPSGNPDGILFESAMDWIYSILPEPGVEETAAAINEAQQVLWRQGLTGVHDFDRRRCFAALQLLHQRGLLRLRVNKNIPLEDLPHATALGLRSGFGDAMLRIGSVKAFADGALGPQTAAMLQPYNGGGEEERGILLLDGEQIFEHGRLAVDCGLSMAIHAIGDRAVHETLDGLAHLRAYESAQGLVPGRHRIEHVQLIHPDDAPRLAELEIIASMQPSHAPSDMIMADRYWGERTAYAYAWRTQLSYGARLAFGSDAPVESPNPFWGLYAAIARRRLDGSPGTEGWRPEQRLFLHEALQAFTLGAAYAAGLEDRLGRLAPGYLADMILLEEDPFALPPEALRDVRPLRTMVAGEWVYGD